MSYCLKHQRGIVLAEIINIIVCLAHVSKEDYPVQPCMDAGSVMADNDPDHYRLDPQSEYALELALRLKKEMGGGFVQAVTLGPARTERMLRLALAAGADSAVRVWDAAFEFCDPLLAARVLGSAIRTIQYDLVLCGGAGADIGNGYFGAALATVLRIPYLPQIRELEIDATSNVARVKRKQKNRLLTYRCELPGVFTIAGGRTCPPAPVKRIRWANREEIPVLDAKALAISDIDNLKSGVLVERYTHPKPRDKRGLGVPAEELSPVERFKRVLNGGISLKTEQVIIKGSTPGEAEKLLDWLIKEKVISKQD
jgi:electron transfer flavoprotein beta subunit